MIVSSVLNKLKAENSKDSTQALLDRASGNFVAVLIGAGLGLVVGYTRKYPLVISAVVGSAITGLAANYFIPKSKDNG